MIFLILVFLLGGLRETETVSVIGELGKDITIKCTHVNAFSNIKYFCKGACQDADILISSRKKEKGSNDKYSIIDEGNTFKVTIFHLTQKDSGTYWCGIERIGVDTYNMVDLTVIMGKPDEATYALSSKKLAYVGAGLGVVVLTLAIVLLIFFRHRNRDITTFSGKDTVYASLSSQKQGAHHITTSSSTANEDQETDGTTDDIFRSSSVQHQDTSRDHADNIYSNVTVSSEPQIQPDSLFYSTVSFNKHTDCTSVTPRTASATYASIKHISTDESTVYCDV
ncbi:CMRF35-like molecule 7 [Micropterus salmoides]|uniref:CMRF35-like molecule 7 n=1 Tax=Micropterus salmoides TaxID=27706 RepID=UPI0018EC40AD|nr:CMRF35-like molecule 7 [Micropterus salmoides]XP_038583893.1 CMRF35-like molecule 7 [Micropterus salmoides]